MRFTFCSLFCLCATLEAAQAGSRTSSNYKITTEVLDTVGRLTTSVNYVGRGSAGQIVGFSSVAAPVETAKHGYLGQLYEVAGLTVTGAQSFLDEGTSLQLGAWQLLDDATFLSVPSVAVTWASAVAPIASIDGSGLATAQFVYANMPATVEATLAGFTGYLNLTVRNIGADDYGSYAGDGIDDGWQVQYFGENNPNAAPGVDADGSGHGNLFKFVAGLNPLDGSRFSLAIQPVPNRASWKTLVFSPLVAGRTYSVETKSGLASPTWSPLTQSAQSENGNERAVIDTNALPAPKFYRVRISRP